MSQKILRKYINDSKIEGKKDFYRTSNAAKAASRIDNGKGFYYNEETGYTEMWINGFVMNFGV